MARLVARSAGVSGAPGAVVGAGALLDELVLDSLDLPPSLLSTMVRDLPPSDTLRVTQVLRIPGVHYVLLVRSRRRARS